jgi:hypothetical protein
MLPILSAREARNVQDLLNSLPGVRIEDGRTHSGVTFPDHLSLERLTPEVSTDFRASPPATPRGFGLLSVETVSHVLNRAT